MTTADPSNPHNKFNSRDHWEHLGLGLIIQMVIAVPLYFFGVPSAVWIATAVVLGLFYGREERDDEGRHTKDPNHKLWRSTLPWTWSRDGIYDLLFPAVASIGLALALTYRFG